VSVSEFSFLAFGLLLGVVSGAAVVEVLRARPPAAREVRVTVSHDAIPRRRGSTLADDAFSQFSPQPARGGPADRRTDDSATLLTSQDRRTTVRIGPAAEAVGIPISFGKDPLLSALHAGTAAGDVPAMAWARREMGPEAVAGAATGDSGGVFVGEGASTAVALLERPAGSRGTDPTAAPAAAPAAEQAADMAADMDRCSEERRVSDERCQLATRARGQSDSAIKTLRLAQRAYDDHQTAAAETSERADPRIVQAAKETAQGGFRAAVSAATTPESHEAAARDWLTEINRINTEAQGATAKAARERDAALTIGATLEQLGLEADAARIGAENADAACLAARVAVAECDERLEDAGGTDPAQQPAQVPAPSLAAGTTAGTAERLGEDETLGLALEAGGVPRIFSLLRGDRAAMTTLVSTLAGDDPESHRHWQLLITDLVAAIIADAIEETALEFPDDHPFWGGFSRQQDREIAHALSSLGFRFDGLGGWTDGRSPSQRDLSLALGYAGFDPMRMRHWPDEQATMDLYRDVTVAADEYLAGVAGDLTLPEIVAMLGRRADSLAEVWNHWGKIRPLLLDEG